MFSRWWTHLLCHLHYNIPQMRFNIFHRWKGRIITRKEMREKSVLWGLRRCFQSLQCVGHFRATWQLILFYFLRCIFFMLIPFHPRWEDKYKTRVCKVKLGANTSAPRNQKLHTLLYIFWFFCKSCCLSDSGWLRLHLWVFGSVLEPACGLPCLRARVCGPAGNKSGHSSPEVCALALGERDPFIFMLAETPVGTTCLSQARNPVVWLIVKV